MTLAAWDFHAGTLLAAIAAFVLGFLVQWWFGKRGKASEHVLRRVVETSTDESTRLKTLTDEHSRVLKLRDEADLKLKADYDGQLLSLRGELDQSTALARQHEADLAAQRTEATRLQGLVATVDSSKQQIDELTAQLARQKNDYELALTDWRKRAEAGEASVAAADKRVADLNAEHARVVGELQASVKAADAKSVEVQGLLGSTKADNDKALADWRARAEKAEADLGNWSRRYAELESSSKNADAEHARVLGDWRKRAETAEASLADSAKQGADWQARFAALEAQHAEVTSSVASRDTEILGLRGQLAEATAGPDDLLVIEGIGPKINQALRAAGITRWIHVRDASQDTLKAAIEAGGISFAPSMTTWSKQAAYLVAGDQAGFKQYTEYLVSGQDPSAMGAEELTGDAKVQALAGGTVYGTGTVEIDPSAKNADGTDNLLIIEGIGPKFNQALVSAGINTFAKLAGSSEDQLKGAIQSAGLSFAPSLSTWAEQAALVAAGDMAGFKALTDRLVAGRNDG
jgi:predicted flap endonuclease-1-like 5' DNA nuclease